MITNTGGPAFPSTTIADQHMPGVTEPVAFSDHPGMTLAVLLSNNPAGQKERDHEITMRFEA